MYNFKDIHIGKLIQQKWTESNTDLMRTINFLHCDEDEINEMFLHKTLETDVLLRWCKLLKYDFFRIYSQHLILYTPPSSKTGPQSNEKKSNLPEFRKNIYTKEVIDFILELIGTKEKTISQIIEEYRIPKTTIYKWISKYSINKES